MSSYIDRFVKIASAIGYPVNSPDPKILDFGCGSGAVVVEARAKGLDVFGCDISSALAMAPKVLVERGILRGIDIGNYRIPFENNQFDLVASHQVLEHVQNYEEVLREIRRVLKLEGVSVHTFPSRYSPIEPHVCVPFATIIQSKNWLKLWAYLGIRNEYQKDLPHREVAELNYNYLNAKTNYLTKRKLRQEFSKIFSLVLFVEREYLAAGDGYGPLMAKLPIVPSLFSAFLSRVVAFA